MKHFDDEQLEILSSKANPFDFVEAIETFWTDGEDDHESA